jgi:hypothetical protein
MHFRKINFKILYHAKRRKIETMWLKHNKKYCYLLSIKTKISKRIPITPYSQ